MTDWILKACVSHSINESSHFVWRSILHNWLENCLHARAQATQAIQRESERAEEVEESRAKHKLDER